MSYTFYILNRIGSLEKKIIFQLGCIVLLLLSHFFLSYDFNGGWWHSLVGLAAILLFGFMIWGKEFFWVSGLKPSRKELLGSVSAAIVFTGISAGIMLFVAAKANVTIRPASLTHYIHNAVYIVSEEMILGAVMLYFLIKRFKISPLTASLAFAIVVSLAHLVLYKFYFRDKDFLEPITLITLTLAVFVKNNLIIRYRHIGYAWAIHFGWMAVMYGSEHYYGDSIQLLTDLEKFNLYLGSPVVLAATSVVTGVNLFRFFSWERRQSLQVLENSGTKK